MIYTIMKNTARLILAAIAVAAALVSCTKDLNPGKADTGSEAGTLRTITVSFDTSTKSYLDGLKPHFSEGDSILVRGRILSGGRKQAVYDTCIVSVKNGIATITTEFTGILDAYYPLAYTKIEPYGVTQFVPPMQTGRFDDANICSADISSEGTMAKFENEFPILRFYAGAGIGVDTIRIKSSEGIAGVQVTDTVITVAAPEVDTTEGAEAAEAVALVEEQEPVQDPRIWYVAVRGNVNANDLTFESVTNTQGTVEKTPTTDLHLVKGKIYNAFIPYYIDLGDAGKWAYCNVGAFLPEEPGEYFMWGEVEGHKAEGTGSGAFNFTDFAPFENDRDRYIKANATDGFGQGNAPYYHPAQSKFTKYNESDGKTKLELCDDAANANWGGNWRMPTYDEINNLYDEAGWALDEEYYDYTADAFFIPIAGYGSGNGLYAFKEDLRYWSSTLYGDDKTKGYYLYFNSGDCMKVDGSARYYGYPVRPIYDETLSGDQPTTVTIQAYTDGMTL